MPIRKYIQENRERFIDELFSLIRIPSVSAKSENKPDMITCAQRWTEILKSSGAENIRIMQTAGNPVVYAEKIISTDAPTVLVYGHYDVMPAEPLDLWNTLPFEPVVHDGRIWGRGTDDDKGQTMIQVKGFEIALRQGLLHSNVKFILEGEEEIGSPSLADFCREHKDMLRADIILVSDTSMVNADTPMLTTGLRGLAYWEIEVTGPNRDLHSGHFGGAVSNPINVLCKLLADITDSDGRITIPNFYDDVEELTQDERNVIAQIPFDEDRYCKAIAVDALFGEKGYTTLERNSCRPSFDVCGIWGGYTGEGAKTILPSKAYAKVSCRLVPHQDHKKIEAILAAHLAEVAPNTVKIKVSALHGGQGYICPVTLPAYKAAEKAMGIAFGKSPLAVRRGGSIAIIPTFEDILGIKTILMGFGLEQNAIHSPNESFPIDFFDKGIETVAEFYRHFPSI
ncbi:MAG: dipeptidase [Tannerellaceae bacterium]|jgi:acetylornithine deacetylase/succinyl-diaminopimelate desuccinylase-like protein|nr:dipeptidase [Tannerellaceae bacterium]